MSVSKTKFQSGDKVFAKMKGYPHWPARVIAVMNETSKNNTRYHVYFYGTNQTAVVKSDNICSYLENKATLGKAKKHKYFKESLTEIEAELNADNINKDTSLDQSGVNVNITNGANNNSSEVTTNLPSTSGTITKMERNRSTTRKPSKHKSNADEDVNHSNSKKLKKLSIGDRNSVEYVAQDSETSHSKSEDLNKHKSQESVEKRNQVENDEDDSVNTTSLISKKFKFITATKSNGETVKIPLRLNEPNFTDGKDLVNWRRMVIDYACSLKSSIESGLIINNVYELMDKWTTEHADEFLDTRIPKCSDRTLKFLRIEAELLDLDIQIKKSLSLVDGKPETCIDLLDKLDQLHITRLMLMKQPDVVKTIRRTRNYVGNTSRWNLNPEELKDFKERARMLRMRAAILYNKFKSLFRDRNSEEFWSFFAEKVNMLKAKTEHLTFVELLCIIEEPI